jgi:hypothetical protein
MTYQKLRKLNVRLSLTCPILIFILVVIHTLNKSTFWYVIPPMVVLSAIFITWHIWLNNIESVREEVIIWTLGWADTIGVEELKKIRAHTVEQDREMYEKIKFSRKQSTSTIDVLYPGIVEEAKARG